MALFENNYKAAARSEIERRISELETRDKIAQTNITPPVTLIYNDVQFAERLGLFSEEKAYEYKQRVLKLQAEYEKLQKHEHLDAVDSFENPRERTARYLDMDRYNADIANKRAEAGADKSTEIAHRAMSNENDKVK